eukprot:scaffold25563_cov137-Skeletonema_dohrnii-CCMP3373.AAC.2
MSCRRSLPSPLCPALDSNIDIGCKKVLCEFGRSNFICKFIKPPNSNCDDCTKIPPIAIGQNLLYREPPPPIEESDEIPLWSRWWEEDEVGSGYA